MDKCRYFAKKGNKITHYYISGHCSNIIYTDDNDRFDRVDVLLTGNTGTRAVMEIKYRRKPSYKSYDYEGHILEWDKFTAMTQTQYSEYKHLYEMIYGDYILMWDVAYVTEDMFVIDEKRKFPKTTMGDSDEEGPKKVAYLNSKDCCTIIKRVPGDETYN